MQPVLYALSSLVVAGALIPSLVAVRRAHQGSDLDLEMSAAGWLDDRVAGDSADSRSSLGVAA